MGLVFLLGQILLAVPGGLVAVEYGPGLGVVHHGPHKLGGFGEGGLGGLELPGQRVKAIHRRRSLPGQCVIIDQPMLPEELKRGGHLFQIVDFGPPLISRTLAILQPFLNVDKEIDAPGAGASPGISGTGRSPAMTARMSSGLKPSPRVEDRSRIGLSCPGARNEIAPPRPCFTAYPACSMSRRNAAKSAGFFSSAATTASRTRCWVDGGRSPIHWP